MFCPFCGKDLPEGASACPFCGKDPGSAFPGSTGPSPSKNAASSRVNESVDALVADTKRAALDLAVMSARVSRKLITKADEMAKDSPAAAKKAARIAAEQLDKARKEIEAALENLK
jgi:hypothetical protein